MSRNCIRCVKANRTGPDLLCDECRTDKSGLPRYLYLVDGCTAVRNQESAIRNCQRRRSQGKNVTVGIYVLSDVVNPFDNATEVRQ